MKNEELIRKWIDALRSGKYKQARGRLRRDNGSTSYCCLGVLCDLAGAEWVSEYGGPISHAVYGDDKSSVSLPDPLREQVGLDEDFAAELAMRNDGEEFHDVAGYRNFEPHTFEAIADIIEERLL